MMEKRWLSMKDLAQYLGLSLQTLYNWKCSDPGRLPPHTSLSTGKRETLRFDIAEVDAWMLRNSLREGRCP